MAKMINFFRAHTHGSVIILSWVVFCAFVLIPNWREGLFDFFDFLFLSAIFLMLIASQLFWVGRVVGLGERFIPGKPRRVLAYGHCDCYLSFPPRLQHCALRRPLRNPAGRFDSFDAAPRPA
jgi:hypothetical protein